ncbi:TPA: 16S rRNA (cytidine(1402)-2'-O)-methyltransferase [Candidatus Uhrbacteria bacterium]|uniref:Ribosomal RNA small subunit methyltransferase I n=2 Tax=Candidatus Uhriibacteriota TaxID=1752732 RepID=A0A0G1T6G8_9BACT|nr:MAG: Ribosomal RNA small subunit methyltransferase I [Candidatus Uhrbacteria bacterium GW2011_GWF2_46_218]KKU40975.1 MAG: Ribosomal RNA small subunit methyltransferase I [Candidatus Uhrbacteria bacterium GW2011_GWE2_46_68]HBK33667.1 16S rRNA (cytidine(1402)-2'-O)-methyltransferase [Candidatus Uhrbacteria bacterium]HCB18934.1 16S rRNA (cytidine(1402)-2'-O)-methyltransferase [Candidatus Uhrbacteria bacterium]
MPGRLYIVATPLGNLQDVSERAKTTLARAEKILCEDTRVTAHLLHAFDIHVPMVSYHQHSSMLREKEIVDWLRDGQTLALVTDAGTPGISDPGGKLIHTILQVVGSDVEIIPIPGPCAAITALSVSGFPTDHFLFLGFPPQKNGRKKYFEQIRVHSETVVCYESTHRVVKTLEQLKEILGDRSIMVARELTKMYETLYRGTAAHILEQLKHTSNKGEFVIVIGPS